MPSADRDGSKDDPSPALPLPGREKKAARLLLALATLLLLPLAALAAFLIYAARLPPLDLAPLAERSTVVVDRNGELLRPFVMADGRWRMPITAREVDQRYLSMLIAYEDRRFWQHHGVDPLAMLRAAGQMLARGRIVSGGSTLSMQVARLAEPREGRSLGAKLRQMARAIELERRLGKQGVLDLYLSLAPFGGNLEGVRAASLAYFGREPRRLSVAEAALLVAIPQSPETRRPDRFPKAADQARARVLDRVAEAGILPPADLARALDQPVPEARKAFPQRAAHRAEALVAADPKARRIETSYDLAMQAVLERLALERAEALGPKLAVAIVVIESATGLVRASVGGPDYFNAERAGAMDLTRAVRSPGSALKPLIYALAFEHGLAHPETMLEDRPTRFGTWAPENFDQGFQGMVSARTALQQSLNLPAVDLLATLGPQRFLSRLREAGAEIIMPDESAPGLAIGLGGLGISLHDLTGLTAHLARGGRIVAPREMAISPADCAHLPPPACGGEGTRVGGTIARAGGEVPPPLPLPAAIGGREERALVGPVPAWYVADMLIGAPPPDNGPQNRIAYKTGTSYGYRDAFAVGFDRKHTIGIWVGRADNAAVPGLIGRKMAAPILFDAFNRIGLQPGLPPRPRDALVASNSQLPPPLRHLRQDVPKTLAAMANPNLAIAFPPDGARIDAAATMQEGRPWLSVKFTGGAPPFRLLVNGAPVGEAMARRTVGFAPDGLGFAEISVVDAKGATDRVTVRLQ